MITINLSEKQARELLDTIAIHNEVSGSVAEVADQISRQLMPHSNNKAEFAVWKSERILPNIIEAWKRKHCTDEFDGFVTRCLMYSVDTGRVNIVK